MNSVNTLAPGLEAAPNETVRSLAILSSQHNSFVSGLLSQIRQLQPNWKCVHLDGNGAARSGLAVDYSSSWLYVPSLKGRDGMMPDLQEAQRLLKSATTLKSSHLVLLSSALVYGTGPGRLGLAGEGYFPSRNNGNRISSAWSSLESLAQSMNCAGGLTILRPALVLPWTNFLSRLFSHRLVPSLPGHDPSLQFLSLCDLAAAVICSVESTKVGTFNVAPDDVVPMHQAIRLDGGHRIPVPRTLRRVVQRAETLDFIRYSWTVSNAKIKETLGFAPRKSSVAALREFRNWAQDQAEPEPRFDEFGMDENYIRFYGKSLFKFLSKLYWRIETTGLEHIPRQGRGILVGMHRGFMPWDGVMAMHTVVENTGRYPRFLTHPGLLKFPYLANFMTKLGGVAACQESAEHVLERDQLLGIFPEGIHGAFTYYRHAYKLQAFGRDAFVKLALRHRAPIIPFITVGSAEIFPIFAKIKSRWWTKYTEWPCIPMTATFPVLPAPLPSKWHTQFLPPIQVDQYSPEAASDSGLVRAISREVRSRMQHAVDDMLSKRRSIFFGSIFDPATDEQRRNALAVCAPAQIQDSGLSHSNDR